MQEILKRTLCMAAIGVFTAASVQASIVYVDATHGATGNTTLTDGSEWNPSTSDQGASGDGLWAQRAFGNSATIYQNVASGGTDDAHMLKTTVSGLSSDTYDVYVYYWSDTSDWRIQAGLASDSLTEFGFQTQTAGTTVYRAQDNTTAYSDSLGVNPFTTAVMLTEGNRTLVQAYLGQVTGTEISVFLDDSPDAATTGSDARTWYDGVGYEVIPEPATIGLLGVFGGGLFLFRRRFKR